MSGEAGEGLALVVEGMELGDGPALAEGEGVVLHNGLRRLGEWWQASLFRAGGIEFDFA